jgi:hypothetical protein
MAGKTSGNAKSFCGPRRQNPFAQIVAHSNPSCGKCPLVNQIIYRLQSSSASRFTAGASGFLELEPVRRARLIHEKFLDLLCALIDILGDGRNHAYARTNVGAPP